MRTLSSTGRCRGEHRHKPSSRRSMRQNSSLNHYQEKIFQSKHPSHLRTRRNRRSEFCQDLSKSVCRKSCLQRLDQSDHYCRCRKKRADGQQNRFRDSPEAPPEQPTRTADLRPEVLRRATNHHKHPGALERT